MSINLKPDDKGECPDKYGYESCSGGKYYCSLDAGWHSREDACNAREDNPCASEAISCGNKPQPPQPPQPKPLTDAQILDLIKAQLGNNCQDVVNFTKCFIDKLTPAERSSFISENDLANFQRGEAISNMCMQYCQKNSQQYIGNEKKADGTISKNFAHTPLGIATIVICSIIGLALIIFLIYMISKKRSRMSYGFY